MNAKGIVAVKDMDGECVGSIVWWRLSGGLDLDKLRTCWKTKHEDAAPLDERLLPDEVSCERAFRRACKAQKQARRLVRPLEGGQGFAIVDETARGNRLTHSVHLTFTLDIVKRVKAETSDGQSAAYTDMAKQVCDSYHWHQDNLIQSDVSAWLCRLMDKLEAVSLRDTGGVYFIPAHTLGTWERMVACIKNASSHALLGVPAMRTEQAVEAALDAIASESAQAAERLESLLVAHEEAESREDGKLGARALEGRVKRAEKVEEKLSRYEALLGAKVPALHERLEALRANLVLAQMAAEE